MQKKSSGVFYADEVVVSVAVRKDKKEEKTKEGIIRLSFVDSLRKEVIVEVAILPGTAKALIEVLKKSLERYEKSKEEKEPIQTKVETNYIG